MVRTISLTQGYSTIIDDEDWPKVRGHRWFAAHTKWVYAVTGRGNGVGLIYLHRLLFEAKPNQRLVHVNGDSLDNRKSNLCLYKNSGCRRKARTYGGKKPSSKFLGVIVRASYGKQIIEAHIVFNGYPVFLGSFKTEESAALFYDRAARLLLSRPRLNFPNVIDNVAIPARKPMERQA